ncbi:hypothetical protein G6F40_017707 [Rhizopus arrhizus]|nr:hypothetical protein G6F40_017707 [Rhizopus arrhizus]
MGCGSVRDDRRSCPLHEAFRSGSSPSGPPTRKATSCPPARHCSSFCDKAIVVKSRPRSSSASRNAPAGSAASIRLASAAIIWAGVLPVVRGSGLISRSSSAQSTGRRFA